MAFPTAPNEGDKYLTSSGSLYEFQSPGLWTNISEAKLTTQTLTEDVNISNGGYDLTIENLTAGAVNGVVKTGQVLESAGSIINFVATGLDNAVTTSSIPTNTGDIFILEARFGIEEATAYAVTTEGAKGVILGKLSNKLVVGFFGGGRFTQSVEDFDTNFSGGDIKVVYSRSTGDIKAFCNGVQIELLADNLTVVSRFFDGNLAIGARNDTATDYITGYVDYLKISVDAVPIVDYSINEGSGTTIVDTVSGHNLTLEGSSYSWVDVEAQRSNALNVAVIGQSNAVSRNDETEGQPTDLPSDGDIPSGAYWDGVGFSQYQLDMNIQGDNTGGWGIEYRLAKEVNDKLNKNLNLLKYAQGGTWMYTGGKWNPVNGSLTAEFITESRKSRLELDYIILIQGENDATDGTRAAAYNANLSAFIERVRTDIPNGKNTKFVVVRIYDFTSAAISANIPTIQTAQDDVQRDKWETLLVHPNDISGLKSDGIHYNADGMDALARQVFKVL